MRGGMSAFAVGRGPVPQRRPVGRRLANRVRALTAQQFAIGAVHVASTDLDHPGGSLGYRLEFGGRTLVYATDVEHTERPSEALVELARGADVLVHDAMYSASEYEQRRGWGHSTWTGALATADAGRAHRPRAGRTRRPDAAADRARLMPCRWEPAAHHRDSSVGASRVGGE